MTHLARSGLLLVCAMCCALLPRIAAAWSQEGHMVSGAIAYEELRAEAPLVVQSIVQIMGQHPDRGPFEVALGRSSGAERERSLFMEMARWPDDVRKSAYDHPTWHYASKPLVDVDHPPRVLPPPGVSSGSAAEAFALEVSVLRDRRAPTADRAIALCWIFHLLGDIHQPLHAADQYSLTYPDGDHGAGLQYVLDPQTQQPLSLHGYWDQAVTRSGGTAALRADALRVKFPRGTQPELARRVDSGDAFAAWAAESYELARVTAYAPGLATGRTENQAPALAAGYVAESTAIAERRLTLAGYRLAALLHELLRE